MVFNIKKKKEKYDKVSMYEIKKKNQEIGHHWFSKDTMKFFKTKIPNDALKKGDYAYFITSETNPSGETKYSIRKANLKTGVIDTEGEFFKFKSEEEAKNEMYKIMNEKRIDETPFQEKIKDSKINKDNLNTYLVEYEEGRLNTQETLELFQYLEDTGVAYALQGHYGRTEIALIGAGLIKPNMNIHKEIDIKKAKQKHQIENFFNEEEEEENQE